MINRIQNVIVIQVEKTTKDRCHEHNKVIRLNVEGVIVTAWEPELHIPERINYNGSFQKQPKWILSRRGMKSGESN